MKYLSLVGKIVSAGLQVILGFGPMVTGLIPGTKDDAVVKVATDTLTQVASVITTVEAIGAAASVPMAGAEKLRVAAPLVAQVIMGSAMLAQHKINDEVLFRQGCTAIASGMADVLNSLHGQPETINKG